MKDKAENGPPDSLHELALLELVPAVQSLPQGFGRQLVAIVLFGSSARGDSEEESDWDLLVIIENLPERHFERYRRIKAILPLESRGRTSIIAKTPDEFEAALPSLYLEIDLDGRILYGTESYAECSLQRLKCLIKAKDLRREKRGDEFVWQWGSFPEFGWSLAWAEA